jgi:N-acetylmuramoyl-L-alanine amidase
LEKKIDPDRSQVVPELKSDAGGGGYTMVPIRFIAENMGVEVEWNASSRQVILTEGNRRISLTIGSREASVNNSAYTMGYAPYISGERTFVHIRFVAEALSCQVDWDQAQKRVDIKR